MAVKFKDLTLIIKNEKTKTKTKNKMANSIFK